jgi:dihydrofolate reductase
MGIVTSDITVSLDGYSAGPNQSLDQPFGDGVEQGDTLHSWMFDHAEDHQSERAAITDAGAFIMGRNMYSPGRGSWDPEWRGWWGEDPPYHAPVFVLTHVEREPLEMEGGTTFHFVTGGIDEALGRARSAAGDRDVAIAGAPRRSTSSSPRLRSTSCGCTSHRWCSTSATCGCSTESGRSHCDPPRGGGPPR